MELFHEILILVVLIGLSNIINRFIPFIPIPLIQIALGAIISVIPTGIHIQLNPELFFVLFVAPLLFNDGKLTPREELWNLRAPILLLAVGLVFVTVFLVGYLIHWLIPSIPMAAAFGLAAILSPTDAVAVGSLAGRIHLPKNIMRLLEGEALMNDASGLVAFKFAIAAAVTGYFSLSQATLSFFIIAIGGLVSGVVLSFFIIWFRVFLRRLGMEDVTMHMLIQILTPFALYLITEELGLSGILAAVAGGIMHAIERDRSESSLMKLQVVSSSTWSVILFILNGLVFVLLGLQIPAVATIIFADAAFNNYLVIGYIVLISVTLLVLRFVWVYLFGDHRDNLRLKSSMLTALSGVRGAVTLAGAFSIPLVLQDGSPFPQRDLIIFLAAGVILFTLLVASIILPLITKKAEPSDVHDEEKLEKLAKIKIMEAALCGIKQEKNDENDAAALSVISAYKKELQQARAEGISVKHRVKYRKAETQMQLLALRAEREHAALLLKEEQISRHTLQQFLHLLDRTEIIITNRFKLWLLIFTVAIRKIIPILFAREKPISARVTRQDVKDLKDLKLQTSRAAVQALNEAGSEEENRAAALAVIIHYNEIIDRLCGVHAYHKHDQFSHQKKELRFKAIQIERNEVQAMFENGEITRKLANKLRQFISYREASAFEEEEIG